MDSNQQSLEEHKQDRLPYTVRFSYGVGHVLNALCASVWFTYLLVYLHLVVRFNNHMAGYLMLIGQIVDAISTPCIGFEMDRRKTGLFGYGKRKTWHLIGTLCVTATFTFIFNRCLIGCVHLCNPPADGSSCWAHFFYYIPFIVVFQFGWAAVQVSHLSLLPELTKHDHHGKRVELTSIRNAFNVISGVIVFAIAWALINHHSPNSTNQISRNKTVTSSHYDITLKTVTPDDAPVFRTLVLVIVGIGFGFQIIFHIGTPDKSGKQSRRKHSEIEICDRTETSETEVMQWRDWLQEIQFYQVGLLYMCSKLAANLSQVYLAMYLTVAIHSLSKHYIAIIPLIVYTSGFIISLFLRPINVFLGRKLTYLVGACCVIASCTWMYFISANDTPKQIFGAAVLLGFGSSTVLVNSLALVNDLIGSQTHSGAFVYGAVSFSDKIANGVAVVVIQYFPPCQSVIQCPEMSERFYRNTMACVPSTISVIALIILLSLCKTNIGKVSKLVQHLSDTHEQEPLLDNNIDMNHKSNWKCSVRCSCLKHNDIHYTAVTDRHINISDPEDEQMTDKMSMIINRPKKTECNHSD